MIFGPTVFQMCPDRWHPRELTARIEIYDTADRTISVYTCDGLDALVDMDGKESQVMDAQEVGVWAISELRNENVIYGEA